jgi:hypothetical protein
MPEPTEAQIEAAAQAAAESMNGGAFYNPAYYVDAHRDRWREAIRLALIAAAPKDS